MLAFKRLLKISLLDREGKTQSLLSAEQVRSLQVTRGSLHRREIEEIRSHVDHTFDFLAKIPWGKSFRRIPEVAGAHHEKLDGTGYPKGLTSEQIPMQSKIMTVADIYDALTARDRPYKKALSRERALSILDAEVKGAHIDAELVRIFKEAQVYLQVERELSY